MDHPKHSLPLLFSLHIAVLLAASPRVTTVAAHNDTGQHKNYLIIVRKPYEYDKHVYKNVSCWHASLLSSVCDTAKEELASDPSAMTRLIYSYRSVVNGFAARLTREEVYEMAKKDWFVQAIPERTYKLLTTHTPQLLGLTGRGHGHGGVWNTSNMGEGIIIGVLDDGIAAGHPSFDGTGMPPPPSKWKGRCDFNSSVCNNKLIGARSFFESAKWKWRGVDDPVLPINESSHGTHTSSTAAGTFVSGANILGNAVGTAAGMAPRAHLAFYQVCFADKGCDRDDILAAMDDAIEDGVDVLSLSLGDDEALDFAMDPVALGGFTAIMKGVFVSAAAGNTGPNPGTVTNEAPWVLTVAAGTTDRRFVATVKLGNGLMFDGETLYHPSNFMSLQQPLVRSVDDATCSDDNILKALNVRGKIVLCDAGGQLTSQEKGELLLDVGAAGMIAISAEVMGSVIIPRPHVLPASQVAHSVGKKIKVYMQSTPNPTVELIFKGTMFHNGFSPVIAPFSSRGPSRQNQGIIKPDITGPGVNILAGVPEPDGYMFPANAEMTKFDIKSGTSMAAPHVSGIAALIKKAHPTWSPAAIKSALMTTSNTWDNRRKPINDQDGFAASVFALGSGFVNPARAMNPGLVYNTTMVDYVLYLCGLGYKDHQVNSIIHPAPPVSCTRLPIVEQKDLNYPSITAVLDKEPYAVNVSRTVTNVGRARSMYVAVVEILKTVSVEVTPHLLKFRKVNQAKSFTVSIKSKVGRMPTGIVEGQLKWVSMKHTVRSPILVSSGRFFPVLSNRPIH